MTCSIMTKQITLKKKKIFLMTNSDVHQSNFIWDCFLSIEFISKVKLATIVEGDPKAPFSIYTTPRCRGGRFSIPWIAPIYP